MTKDKINKSQVFVLLMCFLIVPFLYGFITDINGDQGLVLIGRASNYMADYYNVAEYSATRNPYGYGREDEIVDASEREYPPLAYVIGYYQSKAVDYVHMQGLEAGRTDLGLATLAFFMFFSAALYILVLYHGIHTQGVWKVLSLLCLMLSGIFIFSYERGNNIFLAALCSSFFILNYHNKDKIIVECAYIALAIAAGLKVYPALLGILLIFDKNYKGAFRLILYGIIMGFFPFLFFEGGFGNIPVLLRNSRISLDVYEYLSFPRFNFRFWAAQMEDTELRVGVYRIFDVINKSLCCGAVIASYFQKTTWKRIMMLLLVILILPVSSAEYTGLYLFVGIVLFLNDEGWSVLDMVYLLLVVLILNPFQLVIKEVNLTTWGMNLSASLMLVILVAETIWSMLQTTDSEKHQQSMLRE